MVPEKRKTVSKETDAAAKAGPSATAAPPLQWRLHGFRLDYAAALQALGRGQTAAQVARAAGSRARSQRNLRRIGLKIIRNLAASGALQLVYEAFHRLGYALEDFCRGVIAGTQAVKRTRYYYRGVLMAEHVGPDWAARAQARDQYMRAVGLDKLPLTAEPPDSLKTLFESRSPEDLALLAGLDADEWAALVEGIKRGPNSVHPPAAIPRPPARAR